MATASKPATKPATKPVPAASKPATPAAKPQATKPSTAVSRPANTGVSVKHDENLPAYIKQGGAARGSENVETTDLVIPRLELVQALSPCINKSKAEYIDGAEVGDIFNTVTRETFKAGDGVLVIPVLYTKEFLVWKDRKQGGGFRGSYKSREEADARIAGEDDAEHLEAVETGQQLVLVVDGDGNTDDSRLAMVSMSRTKFKVSKNWNSLIRLTGGDRFSRVYRLISIDDKNATGDEYKNFAVMAAGFPEEGAYHVAEDLYTSVSSGAKTVRMDTTEEGEDTEGRAKGEY